MRITGKIFLESTGGARQAALLKLVCHMNPTEREHGFIVEKKRKKGTEIADVSFC